MVAAEAGAVRTVAVVGAERHMAVSAVAEAPRLRPVVADLTRVAAAVAAEVVAADIGGIHSTAALRVRRRPRRVRARLQAILQPVTTLGRNRPAPQHAQRHG
jgi:hypothetical protein